MAVNLKIVSQVVASGTPGPAGKSAYQIAVDNGFQGTESEWLKELHPFKGWFDSVSELEEEHSAPSVGEYAYVKGATSSDPVKIYECSTEGSWSDSGRTVDTSTVQTFRSGESVNDVDITEDSSEILEDGEKIPTASAVAGALGNAEFSTGEKIKNVGIDAEPTAKSDNLVKSGGVAQKIQTLINDSIAPNWDNYELENGFYYSGTSEETGSGWKRCKIDISSASILKFRTNLYGGGNCCITDVEGNVLKTWILADLPTGKFVIFDLSSITNPKYFYYSVWLNNFTEDDVYIKALADIASLHELKETESYITSEEDIDSGELNNVLILVNNAPTETSSSVYRTTNYIPVSEGDIIRVLSYCNNNAFVITGYASKSQDSYVSSFSVYGKANMEIAEWFFAKIPSGVNYIRVSCPKEYLVNGKIIIKRKVADSIDARLFPIDGRQLVFLNNPYLIDVKGTLVSSSVYYCSDFIELNECDSYKLSGISGGYGCLWVSFYSSQNQADFIGQAITGDGGTTPRTIVFTVPKGGKYVRFCGSWDVAHPQPITLIRANEGYRIAANESKLLPSNRTLLDFPRTASRKPMILFQMDMAKVAYSQKIIDYADILEANGVKRSTYNVLPEYLGHDAYTNFDFWMNTLFNRGNEVALHTGPDYNFFLNSTMTDAQVEAAMKDYLDRLESKGYEITGFIPLGAELKPSFKPIIAKYMNWMLSGDGPTGNVPGDVGLMEDNVMDYISSLQTDRFQILRIDLECVHTDASAEMHAAMLQKAKDVVDETIDRGGYTIFYSHTYNQTFGTTYTLYPELFIPLCEYIKSKIDERQIVTGNTNEMLEWYYTPRVGE